MDTLASLQAQFEKVKELKLDLNMQRGQPGDDNFDLSNGMLTAVTTDNLITESGIAIRNYPGGVTGLPEAKELFATILGVQPDEMVIGNNASLAMMTNMLMWALLRGFKNSPHPWIQDSPKMIITTPGYDRHFRVIQEVGLELVAVEMTADGPNMDAVEKLVANDDSIKGIFFVPTNSNPTGDTVSDETVKRLANMKTAAPDFTIFADDAYAVHYLVEPEKKPMNLLRAAEAAGNPDRVILFGSTSKITFAGAGIGFMAMSKANVAYVSNLMGTQIIGPNKVEQYRHVRFLNSYPDGILGLMKAHAKLLKPKFDAVQAILGDELGGTDLATWTNPIGGYFVSLNTSKPIADRVVALAKEAGVALTPAGATYPNKVDPHNANIRLAPSRPPVDEVAQAMKIVALCIKLASAEYDQNK